MYHRDGRKQPFFFSPMSEWTSRMNQTDMLPERVSLEQLINEGWSFSETNAEASEVTEKVDEDA